MMTDYDDRCHIYLYLSIKQNTMTIMKLLFTIGSILFSYCASAQIDLLRKVNEKAQQMIQSDERLSETDIKEGLTEALNKGAEYAVEKASSINGFNDNEMIRIPFPPEAIKIEIALSKLGFKDQINSFETNMNNSAELASIEALNILSLAIKNMNVTDAYSILKGEDNAATQYLRNETNEYLYQAFKPIVIISMQQFDLAQKWNRLVTKYNSMPLTQKMNPDLEDYITNKAIDGLFVLIAEQEKEIRKDPFARTSDKLQKVFGDN